MVAYYELRYIVNATQPCMPGGHSVWSAIEVCVAPHSQPDHQTSNSNGNVQAIQHTSRGQVSIGKCGIAVSIVVPLGCASCRRAGSNQRAPPPLDCSWCRAHPSFFSHKRLAAETAHVRALKLAAHWAWPPFGRWGLNAARLHFQRRPGTSHALPA